MFTLPLAAVSTVSVSNSAIAADDGTKRAETGDDFATLLGMQVVVAAGEPKIGPAITRPALPKGGKTLPEVAEVAPEATQTASSEFPATGDPAQLPQEELPALPTDVFALATPASMVPVARQAGAGPASRGATTAPACPTPLTPDGTKPLEAATTFAVRQPKSVPQVPQAQSPAPVTVAKSDAATVIASKPNNQPAERDDTGEKPAPGRPKAAPQFSLPVQAAVRAVLVHSADPAQPVGAIKPAPILPEQAAAQATIALAARGNPERPARLPKADAGIALPSDSGTQTALPLASLRPLKHSLAEHTPSADLQTALAVATPDGGPLSAPQTAAPAPSAPPAFARHDFAAMIDRLIEARDSAGAQPVAMTVPHDDFGPVSLHFRTADDGLTVTMASPDPDFARAVSAAVAPAGASNQGDLNRQGGEPASSRQHGGGSAGNDLAGEPRAGSRDAERDGSRQRRDQARLQRSAPRQQGSSGIFA